MLDFTTLEIIRLYPKWFEHMVFFMHIVILFILFFASCGDVRKIINIIAFIMFVCGVFLGTTILLSIPVAKYKVEVKGLTTEQEEYLIKNCNRREILYKRNYVKIDDKLFYIDQFNSIEENENNYYEIERAMEERFKTDLFDDGRFLN